MKKEPLQIKLIKQKPYKVYTTNIEYDYQIKSLCKFLRKQKDRHLGIIINGRSIKFDSISGMKRFASGFESAFKVVEQHAKDLVKDFEEEILDLKKSLSEKESELNTIKDMIEVETQAFLTKSVTMDLRNEALKDYISELEDDRMILKEELDERKRKANKR